MYRGAEYTIDFVPKVQARDRCATTTTSNGIVEVIRESARTGKIGDGKIWVIECAVIRVRTGELDTDAI